MKNKGPKNHKECNESVSQTFIFHLFYDTKNQHKRAITLALCHVPPSLTSDSEKTSAENISIFVFGSFQQSAGRRAFWEHNWDKNSSFDQPVSVATCGKKIPWLKNPRLTMTPWFPISISSTFLIRHGLDKTDTSNST